MKRWNKITALLCVGLMLLTGCAAEEATTAEVEAATAETTTEAAELVLATIEVEGYGTIVLELDPNEAPISVENFVQLAEDGFYDGLTFHRIIEGFMMQGGDPTGTGTGGSDQKITGEFSANGVANSISHLRGTISMARSQSMDSASSQFFIVHADSTFLDGQYAAFGQVTEGMDVVDAICESAVVEDGNGTVAAENQPVITSITIG